MTTVYFIYTVLLIYHLMFLVIWFTTPVKAMHYFSSLLLLFFAVFFDFALFSSVFIFSFDMFIAGLHCWSNCVPLWQHVRPPLEKKNRPPTVAISRKLNQAGDLPSQTQTQVI